MYNTECNNKGYMISWLVVTVHKFLLVIVGDILERFHLDGSIWFITESVLHIQQLHQFLAHEVGMFIGAVIPLLIFHYRQSIPSRVSKRSKQTTNNHTIHNGSVYYCCTFL